MVIYVVTFVVFAVILIAAFRAMGGETVDDATAAVFLARMAQWVEQECADLAPLGRLAAERPAGEAVTSLGDRVHTARKTLSGYQQQLTRFELEDPEGTARRVRTLLSLAIESLGWACRIAEAGSLERNPGARDAVAGLYRHAVACADEARELSPARQDATAPVGEAG